jgi:hypothetical protein
MMGKIRSIEALAKKPGVAETIDWAMALLALGRQELDAETVRETLGCVVKTSDEIKYLESQDLEGMIAETRSS